MRSGRVLTRGQMETLDEMAALSELQELLLKEAERLHFNDASVRVRLSSMHPTSGPETASVLTLGCGVLSSHSFESFCSS